MPISQQVLKKIHFHSLKGIKDVEIDFSEKKLTAILGPNGVGKSTILHAVSCINNPVTDPKITVNHRFSEFFTPTSHSIWTGSGFTVYQDYRDNATPHVNHRTHFRKQASRWAPRYVSRLQRYVSYIGIRTCVPTIEMETQRSRIRFNTTVLTDQISNRVRDIAGIIMNKTYTTYNTHRVNARKNYVGVTTGNVNYSSLTMGAGEQRIFYILSEIISAPNYGLIIIDEIDLLLHQDALHKLLREINTLAVSKNLQIIFTTHAQSILNLDFIGFRHLYQTPQKTLCFNETKPDALHRLTGTQLRPLEIFVEDDLAHSIIKKVCAEEGLSKYVSIKKFGAAINCFTSVCGAILNNLDNFDNMLFVLDGDVYNTEIQKKENIRRVLTGTSPDDEIRRQSAYEKITQLVISDNQSPEQYFHSLICDLDDESLTREYLEIVNVARQIQNPGNNHKLLNDIIIRMDLNQIVGLTKLVDILSLSASWNDIKLNIKNWLDAKREEIVE